jgi:hypothetical protein
MIFPVDINFQDWAAAVALDVSHFTLLPTIDDDENWRDWAIEFCAAPTLGRLFAPNPDGYEDWRSWAIDVTALLDRG